VKRVIVTGDDFGLSPPVNEAIETAHADGILTATCLMVGAPHAADAVARAKRLPRLAVGLHVVVTRGRAVLPPDAIPDIVDPAGRLDDNLVRAGIRYFFSPRCRRQLAAEIRAQFEAFRATGLKLDHVNAHNHMHLHPVVLGLMLAIGREFGLAAVRLPFEPPGGPFLAPWIALMRRRLRRAGIRHNDYLFGLRDTGRMDLPRLLRVLDALPEGTSEIMLHPAAGAWDGMDPAAGGFRFEDEFRALIAPESRARLTASGARLSTFAQIA
jgi:chitin disaccharide deacetylase